MYADVDHQGAKIKANVEGSSTNLPPFAIVALFSRPTCLQHPPDRGLARVCADRACRGTSLIRKRPPPPGPPQGPRHGPTVGS